MDVEEQEALPPVAARVVAMLIFPRLEMLGFRGHVGPRPSISLVFHLRGSLKCLRSPRQKLKFKARPATGSLRRLLGAR